MSDFDFVRGVSDLRNEISKTREGLKDIDSNIKRLIGRDPTDTRFAVRRPGVFPGSDFRGRERNFNQGRHVIDEDEPPAKKRLSEGVFNRRVTVDGSLPVRRRSDGPFNRLGPRVIRRQDSGDEEDFPNKPTVSSSIIAAPKVRGSQQDTTSATPKDTKDKARNRRMFGVLLGTLQKFKVEAQEKSDKDAQRKQIEIKLEEKAEHERQEIRRERQTLFSDRRQRQQKLKRLEQEMELVQIHEDWEIETRKLTCFIRTKSKPYIYYLPKKHIPATDARLKNTKNIIDDIIKERRKTLEEDIANLMQPDEKAEDQNDEDSEEEEEGEVFDAKVKVEPDTKVKIEKHDDDVRMEQQADVVDPGDCVMDRRDDDDVEPSTVLGSVAVQPQDNNTAPEDVKTEIEMGEVTGENSTQDKQDQPQDIRDGVYGAVDGVKVTVDEMRESSNEFSVVRDGVQETLDETKGDTYEGNDKTDGVKDKTDGVEDKTHEVTDKAGNGENTEGADIGEAQNEGKGKEDGRDRVRKSRDKGMGKVKDKEEVKTVSADAAKQDKENDADEKRKHDRHHRHHKSRKDKRHSKEVWVEKEKQQRDKSPEHREKDKRRSKESSDVRTEKSKKHSKDSNEAGH